ncbi:hypothetical protein Q7P37_008037 [Cladosporium fusiforme]
MAAGGEASSSGAGPSTRRVTRGEKRERESSAGLPRSGSKRSRMAESGAERQEEEEEWEWEEAEEETHVPTALHSQSQDAKRPIDICPITDKDEKPFRLMDMPPEIRIEIYRACLTRPFDILLSREAKPVDLEKQRQDQVIEVDDTGDLGDMDEHAVMSRILPSPPLLQNPSAADQDPTAAANTNGAWSARGMRALRSFTRNSLARSGNANASSASNSGANNPHPLTINTTSSNLHNNHPPRGRRTVTISGTGASLANPRTPRPQDADPLHVNLLRTSKLIYKESRAILYGENNFLLDLDTAQPTLAALHQRSRGQIKRLRVTIPTHNEILERFSEVVRLSLRYCWRLQRFVIHTPFVLPGAEGSSTSGNTTVYANAFDILRWLPRQCEVVLEGNVCEEIRKVVEKNSNLAKSLDEVSHQSYTLYGLKHWVRLEGSAEKWKLLG